MWRIDAGAWPERNAGFVFRDWIKSRHAGQTLLEFYTLVHPASVSGPSEWEARIRNGQVAVNEVEVLEPTRVLRVGDVVSYRRLPWLEPPAPCHVDVVHEDADMVALSKPSGLQVLPAAMFHQRTVLSLLRRHYGAGGAGAEGAEGTEGHGGDAGPDGGCAEQDAPAGAGASAKRCEPAAGAAGGLAGGGAGRGAGAGSCSAAGEEEGGGPQGGKQERRPPRREGRQRLDVPAPVHRLGRGTSGLLLCARTTEARRRLTELMTSKTAAAAEAAAVEAATAAATASATERLTAASLANDSGGEHAPAAAADAGGVTAAAAAAASTPGSACELPLRKFYRALVQGRVPSDQGRVDVPIGPIPHPGVDRGLYAATPDGKPAASVWRVLERRQPPAADGSAAVSGAAAAVSAAAVSAAAASAAAASGAAVSGAAVSGAALKAGATGAREGLGAADWAQAGRVASPSAEAGAGERGGGVGGHATEEESTLMEVEILTGRPHQIRIHMAAMGHPLVGDPLYGVGGRPKVGVDAAALADEEGGGGGGGEQEEGGYGRPGDCGYHLHSLELHLPHPTTGQLLRLRAPPPPLLMTARERRGLTEEGAQEEQEQDVLGA